LGERHHTLRFLTGRSQGSEVSLTEAAPLIVGRSGSAGLALLDGMTSRRHARFAIEGGDVVVEDLGSVNGTFVNGRKILARTLLSEGDRVLIGATILKVSTSFATSVTEPTIEVVEAVLEPEWQRSYRHLLDEGGLAAFLEAYVPGSEVALPDGTDVFLELRLDGASGFLALYRGRIWDCGLDSLPTAPPMKVLLRMLAATRGEVDARRSSPPDERRVDVEVSALLIDAKRAMDELDVLRQRLPDASEVLAIPRPLLPPLTDLDDVELTLLQLAHNHGHLDNILDATPLTDVDAVRRLLVLLEQGYLRRA